VDTDPIASQAANELRLDGPRRLFVARSVGFYVLDGLFPGAASCWFAWLH
jgi:hypothetical protein